MIIYDNVNFLQIYLVIATLTETLSLISWSK